MNKREEEAHDCENMLGKKSEFSQSCLSSVCHFEAQAAAMIIIIDNQMMGFNGCLSPARRRRRTNILIIIALVVRWVANLKGEGWCKDT